MAEKAKDLWPLATVDLWRRNRRGYMELIKKIRKLENRELATPKRRKRY